MITTVELRESPSGRRRATPIRAFSAALALAVITAACSSSAPLVGRTRHRKTPKGIGGAGSSPFPTFPAPSSPPAGTGGGKSRPLGTYQTVSVNGRCEPGLSCQGFEVTCPGVRAPAQGLLGTSQAASPHGVAVFLSGGSGTSWWGVTNESASASALSALSQQGLTVVLVKWIDPWLDASPGEAVGPAALGCRPATVAKWVHDNIYASIGAHPALGTCGFCLTGDSGGASQVSYALTDYGLGSIVNSAVIAAGPPHAGLAPGCNHQSSTPDLWFTSFAEPIIDASYGFFHGGPCASHDRAWTSRWEADSLDTGGITFRFPDTRIVFLFGSDDGSEGPPHGKLYLAKLQAAGSPYVSVQTIAGMGHLIANSQQGLRVEQSSLLGHV